MDASNPFDFRWASNKESIDRVVVEVKRIKFSNFEAAFLSFHMDLQTCGICSNRLTKVTRIAQKTIANNDLFVTTTLICGHVYHEKCLEHIICEVYC